MAQSSIVTKRTGTLIKQDLEYSAWTQWEPKLRPEYVLYNNSVVAQARISAVPYIRRALPAVPLLAPTSQSVVGWQYDQGRFDVTTPWYFPSYLNGAVKTYTRGNWWTDSVGNQLDLAWLASSGCSYAWSPSSGQIEVTRDIEAMQQAGTECLLAVKNQKFSFAVSAAEAGTTSRWFADRARSLTKVMRGIRHRNWSDVRDGINQVERNAPRTLTMRNGKLRAERRPSRPLVPRNPPPGWSTKDPASALLEVQYAIKPLVMEVNGAMLAFSELFDESWNPKWIVSTGKAKRQKAAEVTLAPQWSVTGANAPASPVATAMVTSRRTSKVTVIYLDDGSFAKQINSIGVGLSDVVSGLWNATAWSFVSDWMITTGDFLEALNATVGCKFVCGWEVDYVTARMTQTTVNGHGSEVSDHLPAWGLLRGVKRTPITSWPRPYVTFKSPFSTTHLVNATALLRAQFRR